MPVICVTNQKGGCGKTVTAANLAAGLARKGKRTLIIDLDPQAPIGPNLGVHPSTEMVSLVEAITKKGRAGERVLESPVPSLSVMPGDATLDHEALAKIPLPDTVLQRALRPLRERFEFIVLDTPPHLDFVTFNAIMAADWLLVPCDADKESLQSLRRTIEVAFAYIEHRPEVDPANFYRVLMTIVDEREKVINGWLEEELRRLGTPTFATKIHRATAFKKARGHGLSIFDYDERHRGSEGSRRGVAEFEQLTEEVISYEREGQDSGEQRGTANAAAQAG
jgi:chromosome partitioning protein